MIARQDEWQAAVWTGGTFSVPQAGVWATGFTDLDRELPGRGWAGGGVIEILQHEAPIQTEESAPYRGDAAGELAQSLLRAWAAGRMSAALANHPAAPGAEWRLLLPALARLPGGVTLIGPPAVPHAAALAQAGLALDDLVWVQADTPARRLWAAEQVLRAELDGATLVWLPWASAVQLRRLQMAALASPGLVFVMRPASVAAQSSPAPLRLLLRSPRHDTLAVRVFKRRGPPAERDVELTAWPPGLEEIVAGQGGMTRQLRQAGARALPSVVESASMREAEAADTAAAALGRDGALPGAAGPVVAPVVEQAGAGLKEASHVVAGLASA